MDWKNKFTEDLYSLQVHPKVGVENAFEWVLSFIKSKPLFIRSLQLCFYHPFSSNHWLVWVKSDTSIVYSDTLLRDHNHYMRRTLVWQALDIRWTVKEVLNLDRYYWVDMQGEWRNQFDKDIMGYGWYMEYVNIFFIDKDILLHC